MITNMRCKDMCPKRENRKLQLQFEMVKYFLMLVSLIGRQTNAIMGETILKEVDVVPKKQQCHSHGSQCGLVGRPRSNFEIILEEKSCYPSTLIVLCLVDFVH